MGRFEEYLNDTLNELFEGRAGMATRIMFGATTSPAMGAAKSVHRGAVERVESDGETEESESDGEESDEDENEED